MTEPCANIKLRKMRVRVWRRRKSHNPLLKIISQMDGKKMNLVHFDE